MVDEEPLALSVNGRRGRAGPTIMTSRFSRATASIRRARESSVRRTGAFEDDRDSGAELKKAKNQMLTSTTVE